MPNTIGRYEILRELGAGGMAVVYLAQDPAMRRQVALKVLPRQFTFDPQFRVRFNREAQVIASLEHHAIVPVYDYGELDDQPYIVMRFMPGGSLADRMAKGPLSLKEIVALFDRLAGALDVAHQRGVIHRDLKPANILFDQQGEAYLSDFGIAKLTESHSAFTGSAIIGTPAYMSPEQAGGHGDIDGRSDIYSLAVILFELLTHKLPYEADTPMRQAVAHIIEPVPNILEINPTLPKAIDPIMRQALAKSPKDRYPTAGLLAAAVAQMVASLKSVPSVKDQAALKPLVAAPPTARKGMTAAIVNTAKAPITIAFTGAVTVAVVGAISLLCLGGVVFASTRLAPTPTLTASATSTLTPTSTSTNRPTSTPTTIASQSPTMTQTPTETLTETPTTTPTRIRPTSTSTPTLTPTDTPLPECNPGDFFDPVMDRCRSLDTQSTSSGGSSSSDTSSDGSGSSVTATTCPFNKPEKCP